MKRVLCLLLLACLLLPYSRSLAADSDQNELYFAAGLVSMASYSDEVNLLTRQWLEESGWNFYTRENMNKAADGRFHLVSRELEGKAPVYLLAFPGTERLKDAEVDLRLSRVFFGGNTPEEFQRAAAEKGHSGSEPLVHHGFHDYTQVALFQKKLPACENKTAGEVLAQELQKHPDMVLYLTGHSLGGATATLAAARLADMGVPASQLRVITFGAPAVGNEAFARAYEHKMNLTRITIEGDPVKSVLQSLSGGFVQFGERVVWKKNRNSERFSHDMVVYLDQALRNYQDANPDRSKTSSMLNGRTKEIPGGIYVAPMQFAVDSHIQEDKKYMKRSVANTLAVCYSPLTFAPAGKNSLEEWKAQAAVAGSRYILAERFTASRIRRERYNFRLTMEEELYDNQGNLLTMQTTSTTTNLLTPIEGMVYLQFKAKAQRDLFLK